MIGRDEILQKIKTTIKSTVPDAKIILYGSYARGEEKNESDIDLLILINNDKISWKDENKITYPLYDIEFDTGRIISPIIFSKKDWETRHRITPFYENVTTEGIIL